MLLVCACVLYVQVAKGGRVYIAQGDVYVAVGVRVRVRSERGGRAAHGMQLTPRYARRCCLACSLESHWY